MSATKKRRTQDDSVELLKMKQLLQNGTSSSSPANKPKLQEAKATSNHERVDVKVLALDIMKAERWVLASFGNNKNYPADYHQGVIKIDNDRIELVPSTRAQDKTNGTINLSHTSTRLLRLKNSSQLIKGGSELIVLTVYRQIQHQRVFMVVRSEDMATLNEASEWKRIVSGSKTEGVPWNELEKCKTHKAFKAHFVLEPDKKKETFVVKNVQFADDDKVSHWTTLDKCNVSADASRLEYLFTLQGKTIRVRSTDIDRLNYADVVDHSTTTLEIQLKPSCPLPFSFIGMELPPPLQKSGKPGDNFRVRLEKRFPLFYDVKGLFTSDSYSAHRYPPASDELKPAFELWSGTGSKQPSQPGQRDFSDAEAMPSSLKVMQRADVSGSLQKHTPPPNSFLSSSSSSLSGIISSLKRSQPIPKFTPPPTLSTGKPSKLFTNRRAPLEEDPVEDSSDEEADAVLSHPGVSGRKPQNLSAIKKTEILSPPSRKSARLSGRRMDRNKILFYYPSRSDSDAITIHERDKDCCSPGQYLNDSVVALYAKRHFLESTPQESQEKVHLMSSFFFSRMDHAIIRKLGDKPGTEQKACKVFREYTKEAVEFKFGVYQTVRTWCRGVDIFKKRFVVVPINKEQHWSLTVVRFDEQHLSAAESAPGNSQNDIDIFKDEAERNETEVVGDAGDLEAESNDMVKVGCAPKATIYTFDSLGSFHDADYIATVLRMYLDHEWTARSRALAEGKEWPLPQRGRKNDETKRVAEDLLSEDDDDDAPEIVEAPEGQPADEIDDPFEVGENDEIFNSENCRLVRVAAPKQSDGYNCGVFVLKYLEEFLDNIPKFDKTRKALGSHFVEFGFTSRDAGIFRHQLVDLIDKLHRQSISGS